MRESSRWSGTISFQRAVYHRLTIAPRSCARAVVRPVRLIAFKRHLTRIGKFTAGLGESAVPSLPGKLAAVAIGIALASVLALSLQYFVEHRVEQQGQEEVEIIAGRSIALADRRIARVCTGFAELGQLGVDGCTTTERQALSATAFEIMPIKELAIVDRNGAILCTNHGLALGELQVISRSAVRSAAN